MTQSTIDLRRGLKAAYEMDERFFDSGSNEMKDRSGNQHHVEASGGVTVGSEQYLGYNSTFFSDTDGQFEGSDDVVVGSPTSTGLTFAMLQKMSDDGNDGGNPDYLYMGSDDQWEITVTNMNRYDLLIPNDGGDRFLVRADEPDRLVGEWVWTFCVYDADKNVGYVYYGPNSYWGDGLHLIPGSGDRNPYDFNDEPENPVDPDYSGTNNITIRGRVSDCEYNLAFAGVWNRPLTQSEMLYLTKTSGPRRMIV